uniref:Transmembrane protein 199 n=1 Tax=Hydra vulgaris TaxID=6087 RepID=T2M9N9_HYDVU
MTGVETKIFLSAEIISFLKTILNDSNAATALKAKVRVALSQPNTEKQSIPYDVLTEAHQFYSTFKCPSTNANFIDLHKLVKTSKIFVENIPEPVRSPELIDRLERLTREQNQREYDKMVKNVRTKTENFSQELGLAIRTTGQQVMSIVNFLLSVIATFAFAYFSSQFAFSGDLGMRIIFSVIVATIVALAELYFMAKVEI